MSTVKISSDKLVLEVEGVLDFNTVPSMHDVADEFIENTAIPVFDFKQVTQVESAALAVLTTWYRKSERVGKTPKFLNLSTRFMEIIRLSNLDKVLMLVNESE